MSNAIAPNGFTHPEVAAVIMKPMVDAHVDWLAQPGIREAVGALMDRPELAPLVNQFLKETQKLSKTA